MYTVNDDVCPITLHSLCLFHVSFDPSIALYTVSIQYHSAEIPVFCDIACAQSGVRN